MIPITLKIPLSIDGGAEVAVLAAILVALDVIREDGLGDVTGPMEVQYELGYRFPRAPWSEDAPWLF